LAFGLRHPRPEIEGPGLKPNRCEPCFRGMNAPAPSESARDMQSKSLSWQIVLKDQRALTLDWRGAEDVICGAGCYPEGEGGLLHSGPQMVIGARSKQ